MAKKKRWIDIFQRVYLRVSEDLDNTQAKSAIKEGICEVVGESISDSTPYEEARVKSDMSIGIVLGLNNHEAWVQLRQRAYDRLVECDRFLKCPNQRYSAHLCYTSNYKMCPYYKKSSRSRTSSPIKKVFSSRVK